jgi:hypothetical protein
VFEQTQCVVRLGLGSSVAFLLHVFFVISICRLVGDASQLRQESRELHVADKGIRNAGLEVHEDLQKQLTSGHRSYSDELYGAVGGSGLQTLSLLEWSDQLINVVLLWQPKVNPKTAQFGKPLQTRDSTLRHKCPSPSHPY